MPQIPAPRFDPPPAAQPNVLQPESREARTVRITRLLIMPMSTVTIVVSCGKDCTPLAKTRKTGSPADALLSCYSRGVNGV